MSEEMTMVRMCAPTLAGMKTGSLYNFHYDDRTEMMKAVQNWNRKLRDKGICMIPLRYADHTALIYLFGRSSIYKRFVSERSEAASWKIA